MILSAFSVDKLVVRLAKFVILVVVMLSTQLTTLCARAQTLDAKEPTPGPNNYAFELEITIEQLSHFSRFLDFNTDGIRQRIVNLVRFMARDLGEPDDLTLAKEYLYSFNMNGTTHGLSNEEVAAQMILSVSQVLKNEPSAYHRLTPAMKAYLSKGISSLLISPPQLPNNLITPDNLRRQGESVAIPQERLAIMDQMAIADKAAAWATILKRWDDLSVTAKIEALDLNDLPNSIKARLFYSFTNLAGPVSEQAFLGIGHKLENTGLQLRKDAPQELHEVLSNVVFSRDGYNVLEFRTYVPVPNYKTLSRQLHILAKYHGVVQNLRRSEEQDKIHLETRSLPPWGSLHIHYSHPEKIDLVSFEQLRALLFIDRLANGNTSDFQNTTSSLLSLNTSKGLIRLVSPNRIEIRTRHTDAFFLLSWIDYIFSLPQERRLEEIKKEIEKRAVSAARTTQQSTKPIKNFLAIKHLLEHVPISSEKAKELLLFAVVQGYELSFITGTAESYYETEIQKRRDLNISLNDILQAIALEYGNSNYSIESNTNKALRILTSYLKDIENIDELLNSDQGVEMISSWIISIAGKNQIMFETRRLHLALSKMSLPNIEKLAEKLSSAGISVSEHSAEYFDTAVAQLPPAKRNLFYRKLKIKPIAGLVSLAESVCEGFINSVLNKK